MRSIGIVVLAAGASRRMGRPKQLVMVEGHTMIRRTVDAALGAGCGPVTVVLGADAEAIRPELGGARVQIVDNPGWAEGMGSSLRVGVAALLEQDLDPSAALVTLCDQPFLSSSVLARLAGAFRSSGASVVASAYEGRLGPPALFCRSLFPELLALTGDEGARKVILAHPVVPVDFPEGAVDLDTSDDVARFLAAELTRA